MMSLFLKGWISEMAQCPTCQQTLSPTPQTRDVQLEYCPGCKMVWLDFGRSRPPIYERLEEQARQWEAGLERRQIRVS